MANLEERMRQYAEKQGISVEELRKRLDAEMQKKAGPTFEEGLAEEHYVIIQPPAKEKPKNKLPVKRGKWDLAFRLLHEMKRDVD